MLLDKHVYWSFYTHMCIPLSHSQFTMGQFLAECFPGHMIDQCKVTHESSILSASGYCYTTRKCSPDLFGGQTILGKTHVYNRTKIIEIVL